jgi:hypothetical protein
MTPEELAETIARYVRARPDQFRDAAAFLAREPAAKVPDPFQMRAERDVLREQVAELRGLLERTRAETEKAVRELRRSLYSPTGKPRAAFKRLARTIGL